MVDSLSHAIKRILVPLLTVIFLGQSLASLATPCVMMDSSTDDNISLEMAEHSTHHMDHSASAGDNQEANLCCNGSGYCSMVNCLLVFALPSSRFTPVSDQPSIPAQLISRAAAIRTPDTLFRPPITG